MYKYLLISNKNTSFIKKYLLLKKPSGAIPALQYNSSRLKELLQSLCRSFLWSLFTGSNTFLFSLRGFLFTLG
jgi:hypothetical protein